MFLIWLSQFAFLVLGARTIKIVYFFPHLFPAAVHLTMPSLFLSLYATWNEATVFIHSRTAGKKNKMDHLRKTEGMAWYYFPRNFRNWNLKFMELLNLEGNWKLKLLELFIVGTGT